MDFLSYRETGHIGIPSGKGHIRALDIGGIRLYREISHVWSTILLTFLFVISPLIQNTLYQGVNYLSLYTAIRPRGYSRQGYAWSVSIR